MSRPACRSAGVTKRIALCKCCVLYQRTKPSTHARAASRSAKGWVGNVGAVFQGAKERFGVRIVVAHAGPAERRQDAQAL